MNVNAVGQSDPNDIRKAAIETAMLDKEPTAQERAIEQQRKTYSWLKLQEDRVGCAFLDGFLSAESLADLFAQIKSQADRIAELEAKLPSADTYRTVMDERAKLAQRVAELESERGKCQTCGAPISRDCSKCSARPEAQRVAELEKDAKRLDWMDATAFTAYHHRDAEGGNLNLYSVVVNEDAENRIGKTGPFIREAIDAAMNERKE